MRWTRRIPFLTPLCWRCRRRVWIVPSGTSTSSSGSRAAWRCSSWRTRCRGRWSWSVGFRNWMDRRSGWKQCPRESGVETRPWSRSRWPISWRPGWKWNSEKNGAGMMGRELLTVIEQIGREKGIDANRILEAVESALLTAAKKRYGAAENIQVRIDRKSGEIEAISLKKIVNEVTNPQSEVSLAEARKVDSEAELGDEIGAVIEIEEFGRIAAQTAKQVIFQKVREAEWEVVQRDYTARLGDLVNGIILGQERRNYIVDLGKTEAILPAHEQIPRETYRRGGRGT